MQKNNISDSMNATKQLHNEIKVIKKPQANLNVHPLSQYQSQCIPNLYVNVLNIHLLLYFPFVPKTGIQPK